MNKEIIIKGIKYELTGSFKWQWEAQNEANYWRRRGYRAKVIINSSAKELPFQVYISIARA